MRETAGLAGHLRLVCALDGRGRPVLREQSFAAPVHVSKPHEDGGALVVNVANPTAGWLSGDSVRCRIAVEKGARLVVTSASASRAYRMPEGEARLDQDLRVESGAWLEVNPEWFIPQAGARYRQRTRIEVAEGGGLLFFEAVAPGRVASGEAFAFQRLDWETTLRWGERLIARERFALEPGDESTTALRTIFPQSYYASCLAVGPGFAEVCGEAARAVSGPGVLAAGSALRAGGGAIRILAAGSVELRAALGTIRRTLHEAAGRAMPSLRR